MLSRTVIHTGRHAFLSRPARLGLAAGSIGIVIAHSQRDNNNNNNWIKAPITWTEGDSGSILSTVTSLLPNKEGSKVSLQPPTWEATNRAARLVNTVLLMIADYENAKFKRRFVPQAMNASNMELDYWEQERDQRRKQLQAAQSLYATPDTTEEQQSETPEQRRHRKLQQKQDMLQAASQLAEAEDHLSDLGGDRQSQVHKQAANRLLQLCHTNGGVYIKIGQHLANLDYLIPTEYITILSSLFDDAPLTSYDKVCRVVEEDLGGKPEDLFDNFSKIPMASASLAQVHVAYDKTTGRKLAVKVQHYGLRETSQGDVTTLVAVVRAVERLFPKSFTYGWIVDELAPQLPKELDFVQEGKNGERAAENIAKTGLNCIVPKVLWQYTTDRVLCMEFEEGFKATDLAAIEKSGLYKKDIARLISSVFSSQVFGSGFCHCDPHPANVLLRAVKGKPQMVLVDHGLYKDIDDEFRVNYACLYQSLMLADVEGIKAACGKLGLDQRNYALLAAMLTARPFDEILERSKKKTLSQAGIEAHSRKDRAVIQGYAQRYLGDILNLIKSLPRQMLLLLKMNDCLRHIDYALGSPTNTLIVSGEYAAQAVCRDRVQRSDASWFTRLQAYLGYWRIITLIRIHDVGTWWWNQRQKLSIAL
jgi:aarF domain-containing kinase